MRDRTIKADLKPHEKRMTDEYVALKEKTEELYNFVNKSRIFLQLEELNKNLLETQLKAMETYAGILLTRIQLELK